MATTKLNATTIRFDDYWWSQVAHWSEVLGIPKARLMHDATVERIVGLRTAEQLACDVLDDLLHARFGDLLRSYDGRLQRVELQLAHQGRPHLVGSVR